MPYLVRPDEQPWSPGDTLKMPALAATPLEPDGAVGDVELVVDDDDLLERHLEEAAHARHGSTGLVHVRLRLGEHGGGAGVVQQIPYAEAAIQQVGTGAARDGVVAAAAQQPVVPVLA